MNTLSRRRRRNAETPELDVTPFMNLMIVLVPVLLLSMVFVHTTVIELNFPSGGAAGEIDPASVHLEVQIYKDRMVVADGRSVIKTIPALPVGTHDYDTLALTMRELKGRLPDKRDAIILLEPDTDYQTLVFVMDRVRSSPVRVNGEWVQAELFPELSLGDVPLPASTVAYGIVRGASS